jgi:RluA family pseudouridine synthase
MRERFEQKREKGRGQVRDERPIAYTAAYKVNRSDTLLEFLLRKCNTSRNNVKSLLTRRQVLVNGSVVTQYNFPLAKDDEVKIAKSSVEGKTATKKTPASPRVQRKPNIKILFEDDDFLAIEKPVGLLSVESDKETECAYSYALEYLRISGKTARPYVLHRIDKETSGVLLFAKNPKVHSMMKMHWSESVVKREYVAVAEGTFEKKEDTLVGYLRENKNNLVYVTQDPTGQKAITRYQVWKENENYSLLRVEIDTGRKNQIRVQLHAAGHPIVGDEKYGFTKNPFNRLGLHASKLEFIHPITKEMVSIVSSVPSEFHSIF